MDASMEAQRTTVTLEPDVLAGVAAVRQQRQLGLSEAVNLLAREGLARFATGRPKAFRQRTADIGLRVDVSNIAEALDLLDGEDHR